MSDGNRWAKSRTGAMNGAILFTPPEPTDADPHDLVMRRAGYSPALTRLAADVPLDDDKIPIPKSNRPRIQFAKVTFSTLVVPSIPNTASSNPHHPCRTIWLTGEAACFLDRIPRCCRG